MPHYKEYFILPADPEEVYAALTFKPTIELWTRSPAVFEAKPDTEFSLWDESIVGKNLEFDPGKMIRQQWYFGEESVASIVTIKMHPHKKGTSLEINHQNIPEEAFEEIVDGWKTVYMQSLKEFYEEE